MAFGRGLIVLVILLAWLGRPLIPSAKNFGGALLEPEKFTVEASQNQIGVQVSC